MTAYNTKTGRGSWTKATYISYDHDTNKNIITLHTDISSPSVVMSYSLTFSQLLADLSRLERGDKVQYFTANDYDPMYYWAKIKKL